MRIKIVFLLISGVLITSLSGCTISGPSIKLRSPIQIEGGGAGHCPPGQAKKGRC
jgi:hypothetical protein